MEMVVYVQCQLFFAKLMETLLALWDIFVF